MYGRLELLVAMRWIGGIGLVAGACGLALDAIQGGGFEPLFWSFVLLISGVIMISPEVVRLVSFPMTGWIESLYLPGGQPDPPPLNFRLVRYYQVTQQYDLAREEYERILRDYPEEVEAYVGIVRLLVEEFDKQRAARRWVKRGVRRVKSRDDRMLLEELGGRLLVERDGRGLSVG